MSNNEVIYTDTARIEMQREKRRKEKIAKQKKMCWILIPVSICLVITVITMSIILIKNRKKGSDNKGGGNGEEGTDIITTSGQGEPLRKIFNITTNVGEIKRVSVFQRSLDETKINNNTITTEVKRKSNYDIYTISVEDVDEDNKLFYSKMYTNAISIVSECITTDGSDCEPSKLVDLTSAKRRTSRNVRVLTSVDDFKDIPVALCLFNITDNNFITSMTCPESFSENKKNEMILDLYFFRPPAIQRADQENDNITITIKEDKENKRKYIRETNGGLCNIQDNFGSLCTTDMNTTLDSDRNLLSYDELAITEINTDESNSFVKNKLTHLVDISDQIEDLDAAKYKESLDKLLPMLKPYMKVDVHFTEDNFTDLYNLVQEKSKSAKKFYLPKKNKKTYRSLMEYAASYVKEQPLFSYKDSGGIQIDFNLKADSGMNTEAMRTGADLIFDNEENHLSYLEEITDLQLILDELIELSKAGNHLATQLYDKIKEKLEGISNEISERINSLNNLLEYYELTDVFDATLLLDSINKLPISILAESNSLVNKLKKLYEGIKSGIMKSNVDNLGNNIYNYIY